MKIWDVIEYLPDESQKDEWLIYHFKGSTFNSKSKLRVHPGQVAIAVNSGKIEHIFGEDTGTVDLKTANFPFLSKLVAKVAYGGEYPYNMHIYFLNATAMRNFKWGTPTQLIIESQDPVEKGFIYHAIGNGSYYIRLKYFEHFFRWISGSFGEEQTLTYSDILPKLRPYINSAIMDEMTRYIEENKMSFSKVQRMVNPANSDAIKAKLTPSFEKIGFELNDFVIEMFDVPTNDQKKYEEMYAQRRSISTLGDLDANAINTQERQRQLDALNKASENEGTVGGLMGAGLGFGMGASMMKQGSQGAMNYNNEPKEVIKIRCPKCSSLNPETAKFCSECGTSLKGKVCPKCGAEVTGKFCPECGTKIE